MTTASAHQESSSPLVATHPAASRAASSSTRRAIQMMSIWIMLLGSTLLTAFVPRSGHW